MNTEELPVMPAHGYKAEYALYVDLGQKQPGPALAISRVALSIVL